MKNDTLADEPAPENLVQAAVYGWNRFWFRPADPTPLGLVRICAALVILYIHAMYSYDLLDLFGPHAWSDLPGMISFRDEMPHYLRSQEWKEMPDYQPPTQTDPELAKREREHILQWDGIHPSKAYAQGYFAWSIFFHLTNPTWIWIAHLANLAIFLLLAFGFCTRIVAVLAWLAAQSYIQRSPIALFGQDTILNFVLMYLMIGPSGAALSVDRLIRRYVRTRRVLRARASSRKAEALRAEEDTLDLGRPAPQISANLALRLLQVHLCIVYLASGLSKLQGPSWWSGNAIWFTMANPEFSPVHLWMYKEVLVFLCNHRYLWELVMNSAALFTLVFEIGFAFLVWNRWLRWTMVVSAVLLHVGIAFFMSLHLFSLIMICAVLSFVPAEAIRSFVDRLGRARGGFRLAFAVRDRAQARTASLVHAFDVWDQIEPEDAAPPAGKTEPAQPQLVTPDGNVLTGYPLFERVTRVLRLLWPLALITWIPGFARLAQRRYPGKNNPSPPALAAPQRERALSKR